MFSKIAVFTHKNRAWGSGNADFLVLLVLAKLDPFWQYRGHFGQRSENKFSKFSTKSRWTLYALKIKVLVKTSSNFICLLITCKCSLRQVWILMSIHYAVKIAVFCPFYELLVPCSFLACSCNIFAHYFSIWKVFKFPKSLCLKNVQKYCRNMPRKSKKPEVRKGQNMAIMMS